MDSGRAPLAGMFSSRVQGRASLSPSVVATGRIPFFSTRRSAALNEREQPPLTVHCARCNACSAIACRPGRCHMRSPHSDCLLSMERQTQGRPLLPRPLFVCRLNCHCCHRAGRGDSGSRDTGRRGPRALSPHHAVSLCCAGVDTAAGGGGGGLQPATPHGRRTERPAGP